LLLSQGARDSRNSHAIGDGYDYGKNLEHFLAVGYEQWELHLPPISVIHRNWVELSHGRSFWGIKSASLTKSTFEFSGLSFCPLIFTGQKLNLTAHGPNVYA